MPVTKAIILAAGSGERFAQETPKQFVKIAGLPVIVHTLKVFNNFAPLQEIVIVTLQEYIDKIWELVAQYHLDKVKKIVIGGKTRQESSKIGINCCGDDTEYVLIHDAVRPFLSHFILRKIISAVRKHKAVDTVIRSADTIVEVEKDSSIGQIPERSRLRRGQTPQAFAYNLIKHAHMHALKEDILNATDDCALVLKLGHNVYVVEGEEQNIKITYPIDLHIADKLFQIRTLAPSRFPAHTYSVLKNKVFVIIGGTSGIGMELARQLTRYSKKIYALGRKSTPSLDIKNYKSIRKVFHEIWMKEGEIHYVINSAGVLTRRNVEFMTEKEWNLIYDTNIKGCFHLSRVLIPLMKKQGNGSIVFIGSSSYTRGRAGYAAYSSTKAALVNFSQALAEELSEYNIKVNILSPSRVNTPMRLINFGKEDPLTLLKTPDVAKAIIRILLSDTTGSVFDVL